MELLECPFCGKLNEVTWYVDLKKISCGICEIYIPVGIWNTRPSQWISVKERLPEKEDSYIVFGKAVSSTYMAFAVYILESEQFTITSDVTHWMPLPEPPQETK